jgi:hypothetical protein
MKLICKYNFAKAQNPPTVGKKIESTGWMDDCKTVAQRKNIRLRIMLNLN